MERNWGEGGVKGLKGHLIGRILPGVTEISENYKYDLKRIEPLQSECDLRNDLTTHHTVHRGADGETRAELSLVSVT